MAISILLTSYIVYIKDLRWPCHDCIMFCPAKQNPRTLGAQNTQKQLCAKKCN